MVMCPVPSAPSISKPSIFPSNIITVPAKLTFTISPQIKCGLSPHQTSSGCQILHDACIPHELPCWLLWRSGFSPPYRSFNLLPPNVLMKPRLPWIATSWQECAETKSSGMAMPSASCELLSVLPTPGLKKVNWRDITLFPRHPPTTQFGPLQIWPKTE